MFSCRLESFYFFRLQAAFRSSPCVSYSGTRLKGLQGGTLLANDRSIRGRQVAWGCWRPCSHHALAFHWLVRVKGQRQPVGSRCPLKEATVKGRKGRMSCAHIMPPAPRGSPGSASEPQEVPAPGTKPGCYWSTRQCRGWWGRRVLSDDFPSAQHSPSL